MTLQTDLEAAVARVLADSLILRAIVHGPVSGDASLVAVEAGIVKTVARALAEIGDVTNQAIKDLTNVLDADFAAKAIAAGVGGDLRGEENLAGLADAEAARGNLGLGNAATRNVGAGAGDVAAGDHGHAAMLTSDADATLIAGVGIGQAYSPQAALSAQPSTTLTLDVAAGNRQSLSVDVAGIISAASMGAGGILLRCTNAGAFIPTIAGSTPTGSSADWDDGATAVNYLYFESDGTSRVHTLFQPGA